MAGAINYLQITNFAGLNTKVDPRRIKPNKDNEGVAEAQIMDNFEITNEGAMITSKGYEKVVEFVGTGGIKDLRRWDKSPADSRLVAVHGTEIYDIDTGTKTSTNIGSLDRVSDTVNSVEYIGTDEAKRIIFGQSDEGLTPKAFYYYTPAYLTTGLATSDFNQWKTITDGSFHFILDSAQVNCHNMDFSGVASMANVATIIQTKIRSKTGKLETFVWNGTQFVLTSVNKTSKSYVSVFFRSIGIGTDISGVSGGINLAGTIATGAVRTEKVETIEDLTEQKLRGGWIMEEFMGHLFVAIEHSLYYCGTKDELTWGSTTTGDSGLISFNETITALKNNTDRLVVFTNNTYEGISFTFDDLYALVIPKKDYKRNYGCLAPKSVSSVGSNTYYWSNRGVMNLGAEESYNENGVPRPMPLSSKIENVLSKANFGKKNLATSVFFPEEQKYFLSLPMGLSTVNDTILVYDQNSEAWTSRSGIFAGDMTLYGDKNELYFGDSNSPVVYKFNDSYSYGGFGYTRMWKSKVFTFGAPFRFKRFHQIEIAGAMDSVTEFYITIKVDSSVKKYKITNEFLIIDGRGEYIGDNYYGDEYFGGSSPELTQFKRFYAPLDFAREIKEGIEMEITIENDGEEQPFKIDFIGIKYEVLPPRQVPKRAYVDTQIST